MTYFDRFSPYTHWLLRGALGSVFLYHGITKFPVLERMAAMMELPIAIVFLVALAETIGGAMILLGGLSYGWVTRIGAGILIPVMLGAIFMVHWGQWSFVASETHPMGGIEFQVVLILLQSYFVVNGNKALATADVTEPTETKKPTTSRKRQVV